MTSPFLSYDNINSNQNYQSYPKYYARRRWFFSKTSWNKPVSLPKCLVRPWSGRLVVTVGKRARMVKWFAQDFHPGGLCKWSASLVLVPAFLYSIYLTPYKTVPKVSVLKRVDCTLLTPLKHVLELMRFWKGMPCTVALCNNRRTL